MFILEYEPLNRRLTNLKYHLTSRYNCHTREQTHLPYSMQKRCSKITYTLKNTHTLDPICILHFIVSVHFPDQNPHIIQNSYLNMHITYKTPHYIQKSPRSLYRLFFLLFHPLLQVCFPFLRAAVGNNDSS